MTKVKDLEFTDIKIGDSASFQVKITEELVNRFAQLTGDYNPLHTDEIYAKNTKFKQRICHGMLLSSFFSQLVGMHLPGKKSLYLSQNLNFHNPCYIPELITVKGIVKNKSESTKIVELITSIKNQNQKLIVDGTSKVFFYSNT